MMLDYGSWAGNQHLYTQTAETDATHIEQIRGWQASLFSDPLASVFVKDDGEPILNDILTDQLDKTMIADYQARYELEAEYSKKSEQRDRALQNLASRDHIVLCGILTDPGSTIFSSYALTASQCQNETYKKQTEHKSFTATIQADPDLTTLSLPTQAQLIQSLHSNGRWCTDGNMMAQGATDLSHLAWQCGVYYQAIDATTRQMLTDIDLERLANPKFNNNFVCLPYPYFKLLVLSVNLQHSHDPDVTEILLDRCTTLLDKLMTEGTIQAIPEAIITEIERLHGPTDTRISHYRAINQQYYDNSVYPSIRRHLLDSAQSVIGAWKNEAAPLDEEAIREFSFFTQVWHTATQSFESITLFHDGDEALLEAIAALIDPNEWTFEFAQQFKKFDTPKLPQSVMAHAESAGL